MTGTHVVVYISTICNTIKYEWFIAINNDCQVRPTTTYTVLIVYNNCERTHQSYPYDDRVTNNIGTKMLLRREELISYSVSSIYMCSVQWYKWSSWSSLQIKKTEPTSTTFVELSHETNPYTTESHTGVINCPPVCKWNGLLTESHILIRLSDNLLSALATSRGHIVQA